MRKLLSIISIVLVARADCPTPSVSYAWSNGTGVQYAFPASNPPSCWHGESMTGLGIDSDIHAAFNRWSWADQNQNSSEVTFYFQPGGNFRVFAQTVVDYGRCGVWKAADTEVGVFEGTQIVAVATTTFYLGSTNVLGYPNYDPGAANYHTFIQKLMAHEIGHTMWLWDQPDRGGICAGQIAGES